MKRPYSSYLEDVIYRTPPCEVDLGGSTPPFPYGAGYFNEVKVNLQNSAQMPETQILKELIGKKIGLGAENITFSVGSSMALLQALAAVTKTGDTILIEDPQYEPFLAQSRFLGLKIKLFKRTGDEEKDFLSLKRKAKGVRLVLLSNPHSPLGQRYGKAFFEQLLKLFPICIIDEVFEPLFSGGELTVLPGNNSKGLISLHSFTKSIGLGNLRLGVIRAHADVIHNCNLQATNFHIDVPNMSILYAQHAFRNWETIIQTLGAAADRGRSSVQDFYQKHPKYLSHNFERGFFGMLKVPSRFRTGERFSKEVLEQTGFYLRPGKLFNLPQWVRFHIFTSTAQSEKLWTYLGRQYN